jgi:uncharacterized protein (TIGR02996 family)
MSTLDSLLAEIVADPLEETRWLVLADWLEENNNSRQAELLRMHRRLLATCCEPDLHPERAGWQARVVDLLEAGVRPCVPRHSLTLPGDVALAGVFIPPGAFLMGSNEHESEQPVHRVTLTAGFFMAVLPTTQAQWQAVMGTNPSHFKGPIRPVEKVSWDDCQAFCTKLTAHLSGSATVRLPTEAEWEYACRAGTTTHYHFGDVPSADRANYNGAQTWNGSKKGKNRNQTTDVGACPPNPWGLFDLHGNVWEWCADEYGPYAGNEQTDPSANVINSGNSSRVLRGGSWLVNPRHCRAADRGRISPATRRYYFGFRVCFRLG